MSKHEKTPIGQNPHFTKCLETARHMAVTKTPILICGEKGSGRKNLSSYIHSQSVRAKHALEIVDCSQEASEVEKRVLGFREADGKFKRGALEIANGGTVVFTEIDALDESFQKRLFTIFQELPDYELDVRLIATTTKNISKLVGAGKFQRVLWTYFSGAQIEILPLRERIEDLELLSNAIIAQWCIDQGVDTKRLSQDAKMYLADQNWNHNIYELKEKLHEVLQKTTEDIIEESAFESNDSQSPGMRLELDEDGVKLMSLREAEKLLIKKALVFTSENRTQAARILGVSIRTLRNKINEYRSEGSQFFVNLR